MNKEEKLQEKNQEAPASRFDWIPRWGWALIFLVPLLSSEFMFYMAGRKLSMILFPLAWFGFWVAIMWRSGWSILKKREENRD